MNISFNDQSSLCNNSKDQQNVLLSKIESKLQKLPKEIQTIFLKEKIEQIQSQYGNNPQILFILTEKYINIRKVEAEQLYQENKYEEAYSIYKECFRQSEPLPGSNWTSYPSWAKLRISIMNNIAILSHKMNKTQQAIEYLRMGINLEETYEQIGDYDLRFNNIFFLAGNQLIILEQYEEALKYLTKLEKKLYEELEIDKIIKRKKINAKLDYKFLNENPSHYIELLNLICKAYIKIGNYTQCDIYNERQNEIVTILQKSNIINNNQLEDNGMRKNKIFEVNKIYEQSEIKFDKAEENNNYNKDQLQSKRAKSEIKDKPKTNSEKYPLKKSFTPKRINQVRTMTNIIKKVNNNKKLTLNQIRKKKLNDIVKDSNKYRPLEFKFKKPLLPKAQKLGKLDNQKVLKVTLSLPKIPIKSHSPFKDSKNKMKLKNNLNIFKKEKNVDNTNNINSIFKKLDDINNKLNNKRDSNKSINSNYSSISKNAYKSKNFETEEEKSYDNLPKTQKSSTKKKRNNAKVANLPPLNFFGKKKANYNINLHKVRKTFFPSQNNMNNNKKNLILNLSETDSDGNESENIKDSEIFKNTIWKETKRSPKNTDIHNPILKNVNNKRTSNKTITIINLERNSKKFQPEKIENLRQGSVSNFKIPMQIPKKKKSLDIINIELSNISEVVAKYFINKNLVIEESFNSNIKFKQQLSSFDIYLIKSFQNNIYEICFNLPLINSKNKQSDIPFILVNVMFEPYTKFFSIKYQIKISLLNELTTSSEGLKELIINELRNNKKDYNLSWTICLFYLEHWFSLFKAKFDKNIIEEENEVNKAFYKDYISKLNSYVENINKWESQNILMKSENKYINLILKYFSCLMKYLTVYQNVIGSEIKFKRIEEENVKIKKSILLQKQRDILSKAKYINQEGHKKLLKSMFYLYSIYRAIIQ